ncbi:MAG: hypothetical protein RIS34_1829 [Pseudomonadota bacterium]|jgi:hypothetical protein
MTTPASTPLFRLFALVLLTLVYGGVAAQSKAGRVDIKAVLTPAELEIAQRVHVGNLPCEHGGVVVLQADPGAPGFFNLRARNVNYRVSPEQTTTGAIRLEDKAAGVVWLQLANKSMLMNQKLGQRLNDGCMSPSQEQVAQAMLKAPPASVLDAKPAAPVEGAIK